VRIAVIGAGWAGLAAAVQATARGHSVTVYEMAPQCGGRARNVETEGLTLDNGQHIMLGAYTEMLRLMQIVNADPKQLLLRMPLSLIDPAGHGLRFPPGNPTLAFLRAVVSQTSWSWQDRLSLVASCLRWWRAGFRCAPELSVGGLCAGLPRVIREDLIEPLCVAALNTPAEEASASVFLRVLRDALLSGPGSSELLLPRVALSGVFPQPALAWLRSQNTTIQVSTRVDSVTPSGSAWVVDGAVFEGVVLATPPGEAARLVSEVAPGWAACALALRYEPIVTVYLRSPGTRLTFPMLRLHCGPSWPAQFVFDRGQLGGPDGLLAFVISGAQPWVELGAQRILEATIAQAQRSLGSTLRGPLTAVRVLTEKRATFRCTPALQRPAACVASTLCAAGDYVEGPYPATLEGAVRSGVDAANRLTLG
jgi:hydroxysqualene dehydroxylase